MLFFKNLLVFIFVLWANSALAKTNIHCGIYTFYGQLREAPDGFLYLSSNVNSTSPFEIRVVGVPRDQIKSAFVGITFYNPNVIEAQISNNSVVFINWQKGTEKDLNHSENENRSAISSYRWPKLKAQEKCGLGEKYYQKVRPRK